MHVDFTFLFRLLCCLFFLAPEKKAVPALVSHEDCQGLRAINASIDSARSAEARPHKGQRGVLNSPPLIATPLWTLPRLFIVRGSKVVLLRNGLAGAGCDLSFSFQVGAPLACTVSRRCRSYACFLGAYIEVKAQLIRLPFIGELSAQAD